MNLDTDLRVVMQEAPLSCEGTPFLILKCVVPSAQHKQKFFLFNAAIYQRFIEITFREVASKYETLANELPFIHSHSKNFWLMPEFLYICGTKVRKKTTCASELSLLLQSRPLHCYGHQDNPSSQKHCGLRAIRTTCQAQSYKHRDLGGDGSGTRGGAET